MRSVLIIDHDPGFSRSLAGLLRSKGYAARCVQTPDEAVATVRDPPGGEPLPVALIDARLGGAAEGVDLIQRLCAERPELICVLMTAGTDSETALAALRRGACDYFEKSADPSLIFPVLDRCFDRMMQQRERDAAYQELRLAKDEAEAASRGKSGFLATMSHELRTPLNAIIGFSEMMLREVLGPLGNEQYRVYISDIHDSGTHLLKIINDILDLSKVEAGKLDLHEEVFDLRDTIRSVSQLTSARIHNGGISESIELAPDLPLLRADERKTKQVLLNLLTNAIKFTPPGGRIEIGGRFESEVGLILTVSDTGIGIADSDLDRVLQPFEQVDSSYSRSHQGAGLGLPVVKAIMELHGGRLEMRSQPGVGTAASVIFPPQRTVADPGSRDAA